MFSLLLVGMLIGLAVAAPVGPIALLIIRRSLSEGRLSGFVSGLGAAFADFLCGLTACFALTAVTGLINAHHTALQLVGGVFMIWLGLHAIRSATPVVAKRPLHERNLLLGALHTLLLTLANPLTLVGTVGVVAAAGIGSKDLSKTEAVTVAIGTFLGSALWWLLLTSLAGWLGRKLGDRMLHTLNLAAGTLILVFGAWQLLALLRHWLAA